MDTPDLKLFPSVPQVGFIHRKLQSGDLYFVANTSNETQHTEAHFRNTAAHAETWDAFSGTIAGLPDPAAIDLKLEPYGSRLIYFAKDAMTASPEPSRLETIMQDLSQQWRVTLGEDGPEIDMPRLTSWTENAKAQFFSGHATYTKTFQWRAEQSTKGRSILLDLGTATPEPLPTRTGRPNMRAYLDPPVHEAAELYLNDQRVGVIWRPPYRLDVTPYLRPGENHLRIVVGNSAINALAGQPQPEYRLLRDRYGLLFVPQDMEDLKPVPSGLLGPVTLIESTSTR